MIMARIKIKDLPKEKKITKEEMKKIMGGFNPQPEPPARFYGGGIYNPSLLQTGITKGIIVDN
jgi:hypothetical protein